MKDIFQRIFPFLALLVLLLFIGQLWKNFNPSYLAYQKQFKSLFIQKAVQKGKSPDFQFGVRQRWIEKLKKTDRCETCHLGMEDPRFQNAPQPFRSHPDIGSHDFEKFGCTVCHGGSRLSHSFAGRPRSGGKLEPGPLPAGLYGKLLRSVPWRDHPGPGTGPGQGPVHF